MATDTVIGTMDKLVKLHRSLNSLAEKKRTVIKENDTEALAGLLIEEQRHIKAIEQTDKERMKAAEQLLASKGAPIRTAALTELEAWLPPEEALDLQDKREELMAEMMKLKEENDLNQQLLRQSLQFISVSLDLFRPGMESFNYEKPAGVTAAPGGKSLFNTKT